MKKTSRFLAVLLAFCVAAAAFPPAGMAAEEDNLQSGNTTLRDMITAASANDTIQLTSDIRTTETIETSPFVIDKPITIDGQGHELSVLSTGILLGANVTFQNIKIGLGSTDSRNAIIANGYTLTLDAVTASNLSINVFGGTLHKADYETFFDVPETGTSNTLNIRGETNLQGSNTASMGAANIFAGSLAMGGLTPDKNQPEHDGKPNTFAGPVTINIEDSFNSSALGTIYAGGGQQRIPVGQDSTKITVPDSDKYKVGGTVTITGTNAIPDVVGSGATATNVVFEGDAYQADKTFQDISSLSVESGKLLLESGSSFRDSSTLTLGANAKLLLTNYPDPVPSFQGEGGILILGQDQTLTISGSAAGTAKVAIGDTNSDDTASSTLVTKEHTYIQTPVSSNVNFQLLPYPTQSNMKLEQDGNGNWIATAGTSGGEESKLVSLAPENTQANSGETEIMIPLKTVYTTEAGLNLDKLPLTILVNNSPATPNGNGCYIVDNLGISVGYYNIGDAFAICHADLSYQTPVPDGAYTIEITVPGEYTSTGGTITASCTLTVGDKPDPGPILIPVPTAITGLRWTGKVQTGVSEGTGYSLTGHKATDVGNHTATATLRADYQWTDNSTEAKTILWSIAKAAGPAAPAKLSATAPTSAGGNDGKITGTTAEMEYASKENFSDKKDCGAVETTGLAAGTYYVRVKETGTHEAGSAAPIIVPAYTAAEVTEIAVNSTAHKTEYQVGESLDVTNLTIIVTYSDQTMQTVSVTENMVGGFDSSRAAENQSLTITYGGKTTTYTVNITANQQPGGETHKLTVSHTGSGGTAPGDYQYAEGASVTVQAGARSGYTFSAWDAVGVTLNRGVPDVTFEMPAGDVTLSVIWRPNSITPPGHVHAWDTAWTSNGTHHWHDCTASGCSIGSSAQKSGYAPHTAGDWVVDRAATSTQSGTRHRDCTVCGYEMARETIPATGGGSGGSGSSGGSGGSGSSSSGGSSSGGSASSSGGTRNPDGSTTSTSTNRITGTVTQTTRRTDGSSTVVETRRDGTVATTDTAADGSTVKTVSRPNGAVETTVRQAGGLTATVQQRPGGDRASVRIPTKLAEEGGGIALPIPALSGENAYVTVRTGSSRPTTVEIPVAGNTATTVAYVTGDGGGETLVKTAVLSGGQITVSVPDGAAVRIRDNRKSFQDTGTHWARSAIDFVSSRELFSGTSAGTFSPDAPMSRAMLSTVLARLDGADLSGGSAYQKGVAWAVSQGISDGRSPSGQVTREQLVTMLYRYAGSPAATDRELRFSDAENISSYAREAIRWAAENGILSGYGDGSFAPKGRATRGQAAAILERYMRWLSQR